MSITTIFGICAACLVGLGLYGLIAQPQPLRKILAFNILGAGIFLLFGAVARRGAAAGMGAIPFPRRWSSLASWSPFRPRRCVSPFCCGFSTKRAERPCRMTPKTPLPPGYRMEWGGEYEDSSRAQAALAGTLLAFLLMMVLTVIWLFNSLRVTLIIWLTVPLSIIGIVIGLLVFNQPFGFMALRTQPLGHAYQEWDRPD
jgi:AcrB/AcrD/AcrF family